MKLNDTHKKIASLLFSTLMITTVFFMAFVPSVVAMDENDKCIDADLEKSYVGQVTNLDIDLEVIKNTRELAIVRVEDILITQELDVEYSTKENAKAVLRIEDLKSGEIEELEIRTSYEKGEYSTIIYNDEGVVLNKFVTQFDFLEPGALLQGNLNEGDTNVLQSESYGSISPLRRLSRFWWDGIKFVCGRNRDIKYSRPCVERYNICTFDTRVLHGNRLTHIQLSQFTTNLLMGLPTPVLGAAIGSLIGSKVPKIGTKIGIILGAVLAIGTVYLARHILVDERGNMWMNVHRSLTTSWRIPHIRPRVLRLGSHTWWDHCRHTPRI